MIVVTRYCYFAVETLRRVDLKSLRVFNLESRLA